MTTTKIILVKVRSLINYMGAMKLLHSRNVSTSAKVTIEVLALGSGLIILDELGIGRAFDNRVKIGVVDFNDGERLASTFATCFTPGVSAEYRSGHLDLLGGHWKTQVGLVCWA